MKLPWMGGQLANALWQVETTFAFHFSVGATETSHQSLARRLTKGTVVREERARRPVPAMCTALGVVSLHGLRAPTQLLWARPAPATCMPSRARPQAHGVPADPARGAEVPLSLLLALAKCWWMWHACQRGPWPSM